MDCRTGDLEKYRNRFTHADKCVNKILRHINSHTPFHFSRKYFLLIVTKRNMYINFECAVRFKFNNFILLNQNNFQQTKVSIATL